MSRDGIAGCAADGADIEVYGRAREVERGNGGRRRRRIRIVQEAEALLLGSPGGNRVPLAIVCRRVGLSQRALHDAFVEVLGISPSRYARDRRLAWVREELLAAPNRPSAVKQAALALGFRHLGHFARAYRERFGELPSETVARGRCGLDDGLDAAGARQASLPQAGAWMLDADR